MRKKTASVLLIVLCLAMLPLSALAAGETVTAAVYSAGEVTYKGTGFNPGTDYIVRVLGSDKVISMTNASGTMIHEGSAVTTGKLEPGDYTLHINSTSGTGESLASKVFTVSADTPAIPPPSSGGDGTDTKPETVTVTVTINGESADIELTEDGGFILTGELLEKFGPDLLIEIPYANGGISSVLKGPNGITALGVLQNGTFRAIITQSGEYRIISNPKTFEDTGGNWAQDDILFVTARELFKGTAENKFDPQNTMTRAMFATVLARLDGADLSEYSDVRFNDVPRGEWYSESIEWAAENGIVNGRNGTEFDPQGKITREELAVILYRYLMLKEYSLPQIRESNVFADSAGINVWASEAVEYLYCAGIINGRPSNLFDPQGNAAREEAAAIFARFIAALLD